jgi:hypothetical protein
MPIIPNVIILGMGKNVSKSSLAKKAMVRYIIKLTKSEVEKLESIVKKGSLKSQTYWAAYILLNTDEGDYSQKEINERICEVLRIGTDIIDRGTPRGKGRERPSRRTKRMYKRKLSKIC